MSDVRAESAPPVGARLTREESAPTIIRPPGRWPVLGLRELWQYRAICMVLTKRNLMVRYRQTLLGTVWVVIQPVMLMLVFTVFFGILGRLPSQGIPYPVFFLSGLVVWYAFAKVLSQGVTSIVSNAAVVERVYFPRVYFPLAVTIAAFADLLFALVPLAVVLAIFQIAPGWPIVLFPVLVVIGLITALGVTLWLSALNVAYRDIEQILPFLVQLWFFSSPIIYPSDIVPDEFRALYFLNPMALVITGSRWAFAGTPAPPGEAWLLGTAVTALLLVTGYIFFRYRERTFADLI